MSRQCVNPVNLCEPLPAKVHTVKPHDVTPVVSVREPCVPFLDMVMVVVNRGGTHAPGLPLPSCSNKVHKVHATRGSSRRVAVSPRERLPGEVHTGFTGFTEVLRQMFTPMKGEVAISPEAYSPVAVTCSVHALVFKSDMTGQTSRQPPIPSHSYRC